MRLAAFFPHLAGLRIEQAHISDARITLAVAATSRTAPCPLCGTRSSDHQSEYHRTLADAAWGTRSVTLRLRVRRFWCRNPACPRRIFAERFPLLAADYARRTLAQQTALRDLGLALGGQAGARLARRLGVPTSQDTILRLVHATPVPPVGTPRVVGIDDFAFRKGRDYGTAVVDLEHHRILDLLPDRTVATVAGWLASVPSLQVVVRDRYDAYAAAITTGAHQATQVVDRFHIMKNLGDALERFLLTKGACLRQVTLEEAVTGEEPAAAPPPEPPHSPHLQRMVEASQQRHEKYVERYRAVHHLRGQGLDVAAIARAVGISRRTTYRYLDMPEPPEPKRGPRRRRTPLDRYLPYLMQRWEAGCQNAMRLWREIRDQGYAGSASTVSRLAARLRRQQRAGQRPNPLPPARHHLTVRQGVMLLLRRPADLTPAQQAARERLCALDPTIATASALTQDFVSLLRGRQGERLDAWVAAVLASSIRELRGFATGLKGDPAVRAGLTEIWSNGQTEGQINRLKLIKRQTYGRAGFGLLRIRALAA